MRTRKDAAVALYSIHLDLQSIHQTPPIHAKEIRQNLQQVNARIYIAKSRSLFRVSLIEYFALKVVIDKNKEQRIKLFFLLKLLTLKKLNLF